MEPKIFYVSSNAKTFLNMLIYILENVQCSETECCVLILDDKMDGLTSFLAWHSYEDPGYIDQLDYLLWKNVI